MQGLKRDYKLCETETKSEHGTCDIKILTPPPIRICPLFDEPQKRGAFLPPSPCMDQCPLLSNFWKASLRQKIDFMMNMFY